MYVIFGLRESFRNGIVRLVGNCLYISVHFKSIVHRVQVLLCLIVTDVRPQGEVPWVVGVTT